jgi:hypothetical protein
MSLKVRFRPTGNVKKFPSDSDILSRARYFVKSLSTEGLIAYAEEYDAEIAALAGKQKDDPIKIESDIRNLCGEFYSVEDSDDVLYEGDSKKEFVQLPVLSDSAPAKEKPSENTMGSLQISYQDFFQQERHFVRALDRFDMVTMGIRSAYIRSNGFHLVDFNSQERKSLREAAFDHFYKCEPRYFNVENLLGSDVFNDCIAGGDDTSSLAYAFFLKSYMTKGDELNSAKVALSLRSNSLKEKRLFDQASQSYYYMGLKLEVLSRAERIMFDQLNLAKKHLERLNLAKLEGRPLPFYFED